MDCGHCGDCTSVERVPQAYRQHMQRRANSLTCQRMLMPEVKSWDACDHQSSLLSKTVLERTTSPHGGMSTLNCVRTFGPRMGRQHGKAQGVQAAACGSIVQAHAGNHPLTL